MLATWSGDISRSRGFVGYSDSAGEDESGNMELFLWTMGLVTDVYLYLAIFLLVVFLIILGLEANSGPK